MSRIDRVFEELGQLYELNREIRRSVWLDTGTPVHVPRPGVKTEALSAPSHSTPPPGDASMAADPGVPHDHRPA